MDAANQLRVETTSVERPAGGRDYRRRPDESCGIAIMAKASAPGQTKTRLVPPLTFEQAAALNTAFLQDMTGNLLLAGSHAAIAGYVAFAPAETEAFFRGTLPPGIGLIDACLPTLGDCLLRTLEEIFARGYASAVDFGRGYYQENGQDLANELVDLSGRSAIIQPSAADFREFGPVLDAMLKGAWKSGNDRLKLFRVVRDMLLTDWGSRGRMFDQFNGTPLNTIRLLTMTRTEYHPNGPLTAYAREVCGIPLVEGQITVKQQVADYVRAQDVAHR